MGTDPDAPQGRRKNLECGGKRYSARRRFLSVEPSIVRLFVKG